MRVTPKVKNQENNVEILEGGGGCVRFISYAYQKDDLSVFVSPTHNVMQGYENNENINLKIPAVIY